MHAADEVLNAVLAHWSCLESTGHGSTEILCQGSAFTRKGTKSHCHDLWDLNKARSCFKQCHLSAPGLPTYKMMPLKRIPSVLAQTTQSWTSHRTRKEHQQDLFASVSLGTHQYFPGSNTTLQTLKISSPYDGLVFCR